MQLIQTITISLILIVHCDKTKSAKILALSPTPFYAHQIASRPIWKELVARGHHLTLVTTLPMKDVNTTNLKQVDLSYLFEMMDQLGVKEVMAKESLLTMIPKGYKLMGEMMKTFWDNKDIQDALNNRDQFDLVFIETPALFFTHFTQYFKAPCIGIFSMEPLMPVQDLVGNTVHAIAYPDGNVGFVGKLNFLERVFNTIAHAALYAMNDFVVYFMKRVTISYLGEPHFPGKSLDMLFIASNPICRTYRPKTDATVYLNGLRRNEVQYLPKDIKEFLDKSKNGVIYLSFGSNVKSSMYNDNLEEILLETFADLPYNVLWKYEKKLTSLPKNIFVSSWVPQQAVLKHQNVKLFITQGGCQSFEETIFSNIPIIGIPFFPDQRANVKKAIEKGMGLEIDRFTITKEQLKTSIVEVISNPKYRETVKYMAEVALDEPMSGLESAMWHIEYILRHKGSQHLKGPTVQIPLYQYYLLDVTAFLIAICILLLTISYYVMKGMCKCIKKAFRKKEKKQ